MKGYSQKRGIVLDSKTGTPVPFANIWIVNENNGTTSDESGFFNFEKELKNKMLVISALGYENAQVQAGDSILKVFLQPKIYSLDEVVVVPQQKKVNIITDYKRSQLWIYWASQTPDILARIIPYKTEFGNQFLKKIEIETYSKFESVINLRIYKVKKNGEPGEDILKNNLLIKVKKGKSKTAIDIIKENKIQIEKPGLFIALEYLMINKNQYLYIGRDEDNIKRRILGYMPMIGVIKAKTKGECWYYCQGKWYDEVILRGESLTFALKLTLTD